MERPSIQQIDNFFPQDVAEYISKFVIYEAEYRYGERDDNGPPTGLVCDIYHVDTSEHTCSSDEGKVIYNFFIKHIHEKYPGFWDNYKIYRLYINVFAPKEQAYFHTDSSEESDQFTFIYYPSSDVFQYDIEQGGWTEFYLDKKIIGVPPYSNSIVRFSSEVRHRATPYRDHHRFTIALKCVNKDELL